MNMRAHSRFSALPREPVSDPGWEVPPNPIPESTPSDPVNVPVPGPDVIFPGDEPLGVPTPGPDVPDPPSPPEFMWEQIRAPSLILGGRPPAPASQA